MVTCSHDHLSAPVSRFCHLIPLTCSSMSQRPLSVYFLCLCSPPISLAIRWGTSNQNFGKYRRARHCAASKRRAKFLGYKCLLTPAKRNASLVIRKCLSLRKPVELNTSLNTELSLGMFVFTLMSDKILIIHMKEDLALTDLFHIYATVRKL